jgi:hypothetical protein
MAKVILDIPKLILMVSQVIMFWMSYFSLDTWSYISTIFNILNSSVNSEYIYGMSPILILFLMTTFLRILGSCWNMVQFKACEYINCSTIEDVSFIDLEKKTCMDQCWGAGVDGISSIFIPAVVIEHVLGRIVSFPEALQKTILTLIEMNNAVIKSNLSDFVIKKAGLSVIIRNFNEAKSTLSGDQFFQHLQG